MLLDFPIAMMCIAPTCSESVFGNMTQLMLLNVSLKSGTDISFQNNGQKKLPLKLIEIDSLFICLMHNQRLNSQRRAQTQMSYETMFHLFQETFPHSMNW